MTRKLAAWLAAVVLAVVAVALMATGHWVRAAFAVVAAFVPFIVGLPWQRQVAFACAAILLSTLATLAFVFGVDLYLHHRFARTGGYNVWGYRGDPVGRKRPGDTRILFLGGSVAFGYGVSVDETISWYLEQDLKPELPSAQVVNVGWNSEGARSLRYTLQDYEYLQSDAAILYSGYNDLLDQDTQVFRHSSAVFRLTGYLPILPIIPLRDWRRLRNLSETATGKIVFQPGLADRYASEAADTALRISRALERQLGKLTSPDESAAVAEPQTSDRWRYYTDSVRQAVIAAVQQHQLVFVVTEPYIAQAHVQQQAALAGMLAADFAGNPRVRYVNAGRAVDLRDHTLCYDGMHLTAAGNRRVAAFLEPFIAEGLRAQGDTVSAAESRSAGQAAFGR